MGKMGITRQKLFLVFARAALLTALVVAPAVAESWDAFTYWWTRSYDEHGRPVDRYNCAADEFNIGNPIEYGPDRFTFTFDNNRLSLNTRSIRTVGFSSGVAFDLLFDAGFPNVDPNPYATFVSTGFGSGYVNWAPGTPHGYAVRLHLGSMKVRKHPVCSSSWEQFKQLPWYSFAAICVPEPAGFIVIVCGVACLIPGLSRRR